MVSCCFHVKKHIAQYKHIICTFSNSFTWVRSLDMTAYLNSSSEISHNREYFTYGQDVSSV